MPSHVWDSCKSIQLIIIVTLQESFISNFIAPPVSEKHDDDKQRKPTSNDKKNRKAVEGRNQGGNKRLKIKTGWLIHNRNGLM